jgi:hypothetical protein
MTLCILVEVYRRFRATYCLHIQRWKVKPGKQSARSNHLAERSVCLLLVVRLAYPLSLKVRTVCSYETEVNF